MLHQRTTGLTTAQFTRLLTALAHHLIWGKPSGSPPPLTEALKATLLYHRQHLAEDLQAQFFNVSQPTVSRTINQIEKALVKILKSLIQPLEKARDTPGLLVIDGALIPT